MGCAQSTAAEQQKLVQSNASTAQFSSTTTSTYLGKPPHEKCRCGEDDAERDTVGASLSPDGHIKSPEQREMGIRKISKPQVLVLEDEASTGSSMPSTRPCPTSGSISPTSARSSMCESPHEAFRPALHAAAGRGQFGSLRLRASNYVKAVEDRLVKVSLRLICMVCDAMRCLYSSTSPNKPRLQAATQQHA